MTFFFGHYWGIDEVGVFVIPAVLAVVALRWAEKRAKKRAAEDEERERADVE